MRVIGKIFQEQTKIIRCFLLVLLLVSRAGAQDIKDVKPAPDLRVQVDLTQQKAIVEFTSTKEEDVLVVITDSMGITMYLENLYRYKGAYKKNIELNGKGKFKFRVIREGSQSERSIEVR